MKKKVVKKKPKAPAKDAAAPQEPRTYAPCRGLGHRGRRGCTGTHACAHASAPRTRLHTVCTRAESGVSRVLCAGVHTRTPRHMHPHVWGTAPALPSRWGGAQPPPWPGMCRHTRTSPALPHMHTLHTHNRQPCACDGTETPPANCAHACTRTRVCRDTPILQWGWGMLAGPPPQLSFLPLCVTWSGVCMTRSRVCPGCGRGRGHGRGARLHSCARGWSLGSHPRVPVWPRGAWERGQGGLRAGSWGRQGCCSSPGGHVSCGMARHGTARHRTCQALPLGSQRGAQGEGGAGGQTPARGQPCTGVSERARPPLLCPQSAPPWGWSPCGCWTPSSEPPATSATAWAPTAGASTSR